MNDNNGVVPVCTGVQCVHRYASVCVHRYAVVCAVGGECGRMVGDPKLQIDKSRA